MNRNEENAVLVKILEEVELPEVAYEKADRRYKDLGDWLQRPDSSCTEYDPHVYAQGSFRLGTAIKPSQGEEYDLDMGCKLREGLGKDRISQKGLKNQVGKELELYRTARGIKEELAEKRRCWRLEYADGMSFHMDIVPCIPEQDTQRTLLRKRMIEASNFDENLADSVSELAVSITDNTDPEYAEITSNWRISNPEGFAKWFESRMRTARSVLNEREINIRASIDDLPYYRWKTPLQSVIQLLKRHRDTMFKAGNEESKPISVIITTLAARAYNGESSLESALENILNRMGDFVNQTAPYVPNPVNPDEDFGDKWDSEEHKQLHLREHFHAWLRQARADFKTILAKNNSQNIVEAATKGLEINLDKRQVERSLGLSPAVIFPTTRIEANDSPKPWCES
ncbi:MULTISPECIES: nucleotidyltransferase [Gammaproteobacteria]|jgi:hypothetical protein|uniref:nucleotidyltransferase domain-containing protein n=2 Tax=Pseudomonadota TaxID=1224 RepID=UPI000948CE4D|nr:MULTISPECIES: nucleotidyltransferase [Gammaproteobacteria]MDC9603132.1 nucleotidyltransferase [Pseudoalteromonas sp. GABNS16G]OLF83784.1 hypothetical protein AWH63_20025 [Marinobacter sp. C18]|tara:strand:+ start:13796 stop:14992 length:1197 start_codon:yes stop_codon:yes gene_type:complete